MNNTELAAVMCEAGSYITNFLSAGYTGKITFNIRDGEILGLHTEQIISLKAASNPATINGVKRRQAWNRI